MRQRETDENKETNLFILRKLSCKRDYKPVITYTHTPYTSADIRGGGGGGGKRFIESERMFKIAHNVKFP